MKKITLLILITLLLLPGILFADTPTDIEVQETTGAVLATFGIVFLSTMFGEAPEGVDVDTDIENGYSSIVFDTFDAETYFNAFSEMTADSEMEQDLPEFYFKNMSGTISVNQEGNMQCDVSLKGGNIKSLTLKTSGEKLEYLTANGKNYTHLEDLFSE